jgi:hypothetical protein
MTFYTFISFTVFDTEKHPTIIISCTLISECFGVMIFQFFEKAGIYQTIKNQFKYTSM